MGRPPLYLQRLLLLALALPGARALLRAMAPQRAHDIASSLDSGQEAQIMETLMRLRRAGKTDAEIMETMAALEGFDLDEFASYPAMPRAGNTPWGSWSQDPSSMSVNVYVSTGTKAANIAVDVQVGFLDVRINDEPVISGRLAQAALSDPAWLVEDQANGIKMLCIELSKRQVTDTIDEALFSSLRVYGEEFGAPGLVSGNYMPLETLGPSLEAEEEQYGFYDNTVPDQRGRS